MSRLAGRILPPETAYGIGSTNSMADLRQGGQMGYAPNLAEWVNNGAYVRRNLICMLLEAPKGFQYLENNAGTGYWVGTLRSLVELHALSIDGLNATLTVDSSTTPVGGAGQMQHDPINVTEEQSKIVFKIPERYGAPVTKFFRGWIQWLLMNPATKYPDIITLANNGTGWTEIMGDTYSASMIFIEPDVTHRQVVKSWLVTNMYPETSGEVTGRRDLTQANEVFTYDIPFTGIAQFSLGVNQLAQQLLDQVVLLNSSPYFRSAFISQDQGTIANDVGEDPGAEGLTYSDQNGFGPRHSSYRDSVAKVADAAIPFDIGNQNTQTTGA